ncbi:MAG: hypothetical protein GY866_05955 [Proteobacteria bacterium]|nr:hypothetical protein [Pseudomonadota bacterium]
MTTGKENTAMNWLRSTCLGILLLIVSGVPALAVDKGAEVYGMADCKECHGRESNKSILKIDVGGFESSVHASDLECADCHEGVTSDEHIGQAGSGAVNCILCHEKTNRHGGTMAGEFRPQCHQCHSRHGIYMKTDPASSVHRKRIAKTCLRCHPEESGRMTYLSWLPSIRIESHNKQDPGTYYGSDDCLGCHQGRAAHGETEILVQAKCSGCHTTPDGKNALWGTMHPKADPDTQPGVYAVAIMYQMGIVLLLWGGFRRIVGRFSGGK